jgi:hypothetical protein
MGAFKKLTSEDVIIYPFLVNKSFSFELNEFVDNGIDYLVVKNTPFDKTQTTGLLNNQNPTLVYKSIKHLYYSNKIGEAPPLSDFIPGFDSTGDIFVGKKTSQGRYENFQQSSFPNRELPENPNILIRVISIPTFLYGDIIKPGSITLELDNNILTDDKQGNILLNSEIVGNIIYHSGIIILTFSFNKGYGFGKYGEDTYGDFTNIKLKFDSQHTIYETQYRCKINQNEFNFSQNPSKDLNIEFQPYLTTIGLYDDNQNLLAVGKLSQPYPLSETTDTSFLINIDR